MWIKLFRQRKLQSLMIFFVIFLCTTLLNGSMTILSSINKPYERLKEECKSAEITIYASDRKSSELFQKRFEELEEVEKTSIVPYSYVNDEMYVNGKKLESFTDLVTYSPEVYGSIRTLEGKSTVDKDDNTCLIPACTKNEYNLKIGDTLIIKNPQKELRYTISGVFVEPYSTSTAFDSAILVGEIPKECQLQYLVKVYAKTGYTGEDIKTAYHEKYTGIFQGFFESVDDILSNSLLAINIISALFLAIGCIMLIVSCLIINFMIRHAMIADAKTVAVYKTIGYGTNDILKIYLTFYLVVVSMASALGVFASKLIAQIILGGIFENLGEKSNINVLLTGIPCFVIVLVFVLSIIYIVIRKTKDIKPIYALNGLQNTNTKKQKVHKNINTAFSPLGITIRNIVRDKKGIVGILITAIVTVFSINFAMISLDVAYSQKNKNDYWLGVDASDVIVNVSDVKDYDNVKSIVEADDRVDYILNVVQSEKILLNWTKEVETPVLSVFIYDNYSEVNLPLIQGTNPETKDEIAISTKVSNDLGKEIGDYMECYLGGTHKKKLLVTGIFQTYYQLGDACRLRTDTYTADDIPLYYDTCSIYLKEGTNQEQFINDMKVAIGNNGEVIPRTEAFASIMNMIVSPQISGIPPVIVLVFLIGGINIFCIVMLKNANNEKSNSIYKCIGYSSKDLILSNIYYVGIIALVSIIIAVPITILSYGNIMSVALSLFGFRKYPITIHVLHLFILNTCAFMVFIVSTLLSSRSLYHVDVRDLVME
jgi:putative ABC transport system permease protein